MYQITHPRPFLRSLPGDAGVVTAANHVALDIDSPKTRPPAAPSPRPEATQLQPPAPRDLGRQVGDLGLKLGAASLVAVPMAMAGAFFGLIYSVLPAALACGKDETCQQNARSSYLQLGLQWTCTVLGAASLGLYGAGRAWSFVAKDLRRRQPASAV